MHRDLYPESLTARDGNDIEEEEEEGCACRFDLALSFHNPLSTSVAEGTCDKDDDDDDDDDDEEECVGNSDSESAESSGVSVIPSLLKMREDEVLSLSALPPLPLRLSPPRCGVPSPKIWATETEAEDEEEEDDEEDEEDEEE